jgi:ribonuclease E
MIKKMLINATHTEENRVAIVEDGILTELDIEIAGREQTRGNIYKAAVVRVEPGLQAAFIDYGGERLGFLQMGELHPSFFQAAEDPENRGRLRITDVLKRGQELLVQVVKEERGTKGAALTTFLSLPGRYMVLMPDSDTKGVSRKIEEDSQRKKLKEAMSSLSLPSDMGYIVRTAGIGQTPEELKRDFDYLLRVYQNIKSIAGRAKAPALVYKESNLVIRSIRDYFTSDMDEVLVDDPRVFQEAKDFFQQVMPEYARLVKLHQERRPIFSRYQIEEQIETISKNKVPLPSGGSIVIDVTEALVAIDVNSGKMAGEQGVEATAYKTNLEAAAEAGRQLRLRDLGGLIVLDFIDMRDRKHIREVEKRLKDALKYDKARVTVGRISQFGMLEMSRQRIKAALAEGSFLTCPHCGGSGRIKSPEAQTVAFLRKVHAGVAKGQIGRVEGEIPLEVATYLLNTKREELVEMERQHNLSIFVRGRPDFVAGQVELTFIKREKEELPAEAAEEVPLRPAEGEPAAAVIEPAAELSETPPATAGEESARKKRKRRRRKKPGEELPVSHVAGETGASVEAPIPAAGPSEGTAPAESFASGSAQTQPLPAESEEAARKKRKRRRRKKPGEEHPIEAAATPAEESSLEIEEVEVRQDVLVPAGEAAAEAPAGQGGPEGEEELVLQAEAQHRKRRRRRKKKPLEPGAAEPPALTGGVGELPIPPEPVAEEAPVSGEPAPKVEMEKPRARRKKKPAAAPGKVEEPAAPPGTATETMPSPASREASPQPVATAPAAADKEPPSPPKTLPAAAVKGEAKEPPSAAVAADQEKPAPSRKRRPVRKKAGGPPDVEKGGLPPGQEAVEKAGPGGEPPPARRERSGTPADAASGGEDKAGEKPKKPATRRKSPAKKAPAEEGKQP